MIMEPLSFTLAISLISHLAACGMPARASEEPPRDTAINEVPAWFPKAAPLPVPQGEVIRVTTVDELLTAVDRVGPGGTVLLADGLYRLPRVMILREKKDITIRSAAGDPTRVVLSGGGWDSDAKGDDILHVGRCEGVTIAGLTFADCRSYGIKVEAENAPKDIHIYNCRFRDIGVRAIKGSAGQDPNVHAVKGSVRYCYFENTKVPPADWLYGGDYVAAIDMMALDGWTFSDNVFRHIKGRNGGGRAAIFIWVRSQHVVVERNLIVNCDRGVAFGNPGQSTANLAGERLVYVRDGIIRNNFIGGGPDCGIELWYADRVRVYNNSIWRPERNWSRGIRIGTGTGRAEIVNNLVHGEIRFEGGQAELRSNLAGRLDDYFVDPASGDLTLTASAAGAIDRGASLPEIIDDIRGRPRSGSIDIGAWESDDTRHPTPVSVSTPEATGKQTQEVTPLSPRTERFTRIETLPVGEFSIDLCRREDGAFGLGEIRRGTLPLRRADFLITWQVDGKYPAFERRDGLTVRLREPASTLTLGAETRDCAGTRFAGLRMHFQAQRGPIVERASWELGGSTRGLSYFDGYRGWHAPPQWQDADAVPPTNPKLMPSLLAGAGFQFQHDPDGALVHFHTSPGDRLHNASRGEVLEFETTFDGSPVIERFVFLTAGDSRINLWTRACELVHAELRRKFGLPDRVREIFLQWPPFSRKGFRETARQCAGVTAREGFTGASIDVIWDNADFHGGAKNMNVWDYTVCEGYGGQAGLRDLVEECKEHDLRVIAWVPAGHLWSQSPVWKAHPDWVLLNSRGETFVNPAGGIWHGALDRSFHDYWRNRVVGVVQEFGLDGLWLDTHLSYAQQSRPPDHGAKLASIYGGFVRAGARHLLVEGDASAFGSYAIAIGDEWEKEWGKVPDPDLYYGATLAGGSMDPRFYLAHLRRYVAAGAPWIINWDFLFSDKLKGDDLDAGRREVRQVVQDYGRVKDRMVHRFVHADGSGYTWTNDRDATRVVWLLQDASLPDSRRGQAGQVYVIP